MTSVPHEAELEPEVTTIARPLSGAPYGRSTTAATEAEEHEREVFGRDRATAPPAPSGRGENSIITRIAKAAAREGGDGGDEKRRYRPGRLFDIW